MKIIKDCDHIIAWGYEDFWGGAIKQSELKDTVRLVIRSVTKWAAASNAHKPTANKKLALITSGINRVVLEAEDDITIFDYCPICGTKIDW